MASRAEPLAGRLVVGLVFRVRGAAVFLVDCFVGAMNSGCSLMEAWANAAPGTPLAWAAIRRGTRLAMSLVPVPDLRYVIDEEPGLRRRRAGRSFRYLDADGASVHDVTTLARVRSLAIPPAWTDVWICRTADGHLQATR